MIKPLPISLTKNLTEKQREHFPADVVAGQFLIEVLLQRTLEEISAVESQLLNLDNATDMKLASLTGEMRGLRQTADLLDNILYGRSDALKHTLTIRRIAPWLTNPKAQLSSTPAEYKPL